MPEVQAMHASLSRNESGGRRRKGLEQVLVACNRAKIRRHAEDLEGFAG
jgi:hypothetical protein